MRSILALTAVLILTFVFYQNCGSRKPENSKAHVSVVTDSADSENLNSESGGPDEEAVSTVPAATATLVKEKCEYYADGSLWPDLTYAINTPYKNVLFAQVWGPITQCRDGSWFISPSPGPKPIQSYDACEFQFNAAFAWFSGGGTICGKQVGAAAGNPRARLAIMERQGYVPHKVAAAISSYQEPNAALTPCESYTIDWGDGVVESYSSENCTNQMGPHNRFHTYSKAGNYGVVLTTNSGLTREKKIIVHPK